MYDCILHVNCYYENDIIIGLSAVYIDREKAIEGRPTPHRYNINLERGTEGLKKLCAIYIQTGRKP